MKLLSKICNHWTAGNYNPCQQDLKSYHYLINAKGKIFLGTHKPEDNLDCTDGNYAKHCGGGNTACIGVSVCAMKGFSETKKQTSCPITKEQIEALCCLNAYLSIKHVIPVVENKIFTHYEFDQKRPKGKREGKIDIAYIPYLPNLSPQSVGNYLRGKINWYRERILKGKYKLTKKGNYYEFIAIN